MKPVGSWLHPTGQRVCGSLAGLAVQFELPSEHTEPVGGAHCCSGAQCCSLERHLEPIKRLSECNKLNYRELSKQSQTTSCCHKITSSKTTTTGSDQSKLRAANNEPTFRWRTRTRTRTRQKQSQSQALFLRGSIERSVVNLVVINRYKSALNIIIKLLALFTCLLTIGHLARAYQLTNNLIANNLPPKFASTSGATGGGGGNSEIVVRVKEGPQSIGKLIYTLRGEDPDEDALTFGVLGSLASDLLRIENVPGNQANVYLRKELDRETTESHQIVITLTDGKLGRGNWITKSMLIIVEDVNDNYPVFHPHRTAIGVREDARAPLIIETVEANDADEGRFGQVIYKLDEITNSGELNGARQQQSMFAIENIDGKGVISLIGQLDYEVRQLFQLRVLAIDRAAESERLSTSTSIMVSVEDCQDQPPMFTFAPSITRIPEHLELGAPIVRVAAIDGDRGLNKPIKYALVSVNGQEAGHERNLFSINSDTGQISVAHELDREASTQPPEVVVASGHHSSWLSGGSLFGLASQTTSSGSGGVNSKSSQPGVYVLQVRASELDSSEPSEAQTELTVILTDINDEPPKFGQTQYFGELLENSLGDTLVTFVTALSSSSAKLNNNDNNLLGFQTTAQTNPVGDRKQLEAAQLLAATKVVDPDQGTNGTFSLHLEGEHGHLFEVWPREATNEANLVIKVSQEAANEANLLDYERTKELKFSIVAREKYPTPARLISGRPFEARAQMRVQLRDANDNYPQFDSELYRVEIPENAQRGMHICAVRAVDFDSGFYGTPGVRYTEIRGERAHVFKLDPQTGVITLKTNEHQFDRETIGQHHLIVEARDNNGQGNRNTTQLLIVLTDINDQRPKFLLDQYEAFIYENEPDFQSPLQVQAIDRDAPGTANSRLSYSIVGGDPQRNFTIDPASGRIRVRGTLLNKGPLNSTSVNNETVELTSTSGGLDFERIAQKRDETRQFNLTVRASDSGVPEQLWSTTQVLVLVYDKNDHAPVFTRSIYAKSVREDAREGSPIVQVQAHDDDHSPANSKLSYRIASGASDKFVIDPESGLISIAAGANLDIERASGVDKHHQQHQQQQQQQQQKRTNYLLSVLASDASFGPSQKSASTLVNISIIDVNNKPPEFVSLGGSQQTTTTTTSSAAASTAVVHVNEDAPFGLVVTRVQAIDPDASAELRYSIDYARSEARNDEMALVEPQLYRDCFAIDQRDGTIRVNKQLDRELFDQVKLRLQVEDLAAQTADQVGQAHLLIKLIDVNDNRPMFKRPVYRAVVNENSISGTSIITMQAEDRDLNKTMRYSLEVTAPELARLVRINSRSGELTVNDKIDRELYPLINVTVRAEDSGQPRPLSGTAQLLITVRDENDNNPVFVSATTALNQIDSWPNSSGQLKPEARNHNNNATPATTLTGYKLRSSLGAPTIADEQLATTTTTSAESSGQPSIVELAASKTPLQLLAPGSSVTISEDAQLGQPVAYVRAEDADAGNNGRITYLLDGATSAGKFRIERDTGVISVAGPLDREQQARYQLIIEACDNFDLGYSTGESRRAFTQISVIISDVNDNAPVLATNLRQLSTASVATAARNSELRSLASYPSYDEAMASQGPLELALAECLLIDEFQALGEPVLTLTASDADDPDTANGQVDVAIINSLAQGDLFGLVNLENQAISSTTTSSSSSTSDAPLELERGGRHLAAETTTSSGGTHAQAAATQQRNASKQQWHLVAIQSLHERVGNYSILVRATDRGQPISLSSIKLINICVQDVNNHAPKFVGSALNHTIRVMENATIGTFVIQVEAQDADHGQNGEVHYSLKQSSAPKGQQADDWLSFRIDRLTGVISTARLFNRQLKKHFTLRVQAHDLGRPTSLSSDIDLSILIVNSGAYQPEFADDKQQQALQFTENVAPGSEWFTLVQTSNLDDDPALINTMAPETWASSLESKSSLGYKLAASSVCYYIVDGDDYEQVFTLDKYSHRLTNERALDREQRANYTLIVQASNNCQQRPTTTTVVGAHSNLRQQRLLATPQGGATSAAQHKPELASNKKQKVVHAAGASAGAGAAEAVQSGAAHRQFDALLAADKSLLRVNIKVRDVNDNAPKFTQRIYTGGITTEADFGQVFMIVQALDADEEANGQVAYSIVRPIKRNLMLAGQQQQQRPLAPRFSSSSSSNASNVGGSLLIQARSKRTAPPPMVALLSNELLSSAREQDDDSIGVAQSGNESENGNENDDNDELFLINKTSGEISLNFDPQKHMKGYFEFEIRARDSDGLWDSARVLIYLLRQDQRVKFVLRLTPQELRQRLHKFRSVFGNITGAIVNIDSYKYYENHDGTVDKKKTSLFLHFVHPEENTIIDVDKVLTLIDNNIDYLDELYKEFHVLSSEAAQLGLVGTGGVVGGIVGGNALVEPMDQVRTGLLGVAAFLALMLLLVVALCVKQRTRFERQLKAATASAFGAPPLNLEADFESQANLPNTNLHSQDPNPIWLQQSSVVAAAANANNHQYGDHMDHWLASPFASTNLECAQAKQRAASRVSTLSAGGGLRAPQANGRAGKPPKSVAGDTHRRQLTHQNDDDDDEQVDIDVSSASALSAASSPTNSSECRSALSTVNIVGQQRGAQASSVAPRSHSLDSGGQASSSGSNSGSASTTNERRALCAAAPPPSGEQPKAAYCTMSRRLKPAADHKPCQQQQQQQQQQSTFGQLQQPGAFKEVTIYTEQRAAQQRPAGGGDLARAINQSSQQQGGAAQPKGQAPGQQSHKSVFVQQLGRAPQPIGKQQQRIVIHSSGADVSQGIIKQQQQQCKAPSSAKLPQVPHKQQQQQQQQQHAHQQAHQFETNLSKLSILNLETTEL